jgi:hypothetical protein
LVKAKPSLRDVHVSQCRHEFSSVTLELFEKPAESHQQFLTWAEHVIFFAQQVGQSSLDEYTVLLSFGMWCLENTLLAQNTQHFE